MRIQSVNGKAIRDSRGDQTIEATVAFINGGKGTASVPHGKSIGIFEAKYVPASKALEFINTDINKEIVLWNVEDQKTFDERLAEFDGTPDKSRLGANTLLALSLAFARANSIQKNLELWEYIRGMLPKNYINFAIPKLYMNFINGGRHAKNNLDFQEYIIVPQYESIKQSCDFGRIFYRSVGEYLKEIFGEKALEIGDEGGFAPRFNHNLEPYEIFEAVANKKGLDGKIGYGIDAAANNIKMSSKDLMDIYKKMHESFNVNYIEDPFSEEDFGNFAELKTEIGNNAAIVGDDLIATNVKRMRRAKKMNSINGVIIKPNQIGTLSETIDAILFAKKSGWKVFISHRSGETMDAFIADLAWGAGADGAKFGAPVQKERVAKYNRLIEIENKENSFK